MAVDTEAAVAVITRVAAPAVAVVLAAVRVRADSGSAHVLSAAFNGAAQDRWADASGTGLIRLPNGPVRRNNFAA